MAKCQLYYQTKTKCTKMYKLSKQKSNKNVKMHYNMQSFLKTKNLCKTHIKKTYTKLKIQNVKSIASQDDTSDHDAKQPFSQCLLMC